MSNRKLLLIILILGLGGIALLTFRLFFIKTARVPGGAMSNTIVPGDTVVMVKSFGEIERGQVVLFQFPNDPDRYIKRVVGLPGQTIQFRGRTIYINGRPLNEQKILVDADDGRGNPLQNQIQRRFRTVCSVHSRTEEEEDPSLDVTKFGTHEPLRLSADNYFLSDNRDNSEDSRYRGPVPRDLIWGTAVLIYYSEHSDRIFSEYIESCFTLGSEPADTHVDRRSDE